MKVIGHPAFPKSPRSDGHPTIASSNPGHWLRGGEELRIAFDEARWRRRMLGKDLTIKETSEKRKGRRDTNERSDTEELKRDIRSNQRDGKLQDALQAVMASSARHGKPRVPKPEDAARHIERRRTLPLP